MTWKFLRLLIAGVLLIAPPLVGVMFSGKPLAPYLTLMPSTLYVEKPAFSWPVFVMLALLIGCCTLPFLYRLAYPPVGSIPMNHSACKPSAAFPKWGWLGLILLTSSWGLAWADIPGGPPWQRYTFTPLWLGYILLINAWCEKQHGNSLIRSQPGRFGWLFLVSAVFWWFFEYLNLFVHNWYYIGPPITPLTRTLTASLSFSTVLPAVMSTLYWLAGFQRCQRAFTRYVTFPVPRPKLLAGLALLAAIASLFALGAWPDSFFPLVWVSPLIVLVALETLAGKPTLFTVIPGGDWRPFALPALAGLQCGLLWELWNFGSKAPWIYNIPYVDRFYLFEMPLLGYAGYLPFGLECALIASMLGVTVHATQVCDGK
ncbi:hypothetical protein [Photobacterium atrarenae]|uniref:Mechanosensitive ion channel protein MscS n=1 Tax=Photobacterium atrarenae TaxID=865757 RepID=A0ABY5GI40_9GAMM|nr:hypothetical protein [Photobacterium atrarenae]UTV28800.1 hypothetical protein NNL38_06030 [Photobacterium atrarenae]